ncbi:MAG: hypothetical protein M5U34_02765 [Chloroflexi bacterium]|nr:hypothetical protein [Chloroflexota bacterium]
MLVGILIPMIILLVPQWRTHAKLQTLATAMVVVGLILYRWDTNMLGQMVVYSYLPYDPAALFISYVPSLVEIGAGLGVIAYGLLAFTIGVRYFRIIDHDEEADAEPVLAPVVVPALSGD